MLVSIDVDNPNEYDDDAFTRASVEANSAIEALFEAGASGENIADVIENALKNAGAS